MFTNEIYQQALEEFSRGKRIGAEKGIYEGLLYGVVINIFSSVSYMEIINSAFGLLVILFGIISDAKTDYFLHPKEFERVVREAGTKQIFRLGYIKTNPLFRNCGLILALFTGILLQAIARAYITNEPSIKVDVHWAFKIALALNIITLILLIIKVRIKLPNKYNDLPL